MLNNMAITEELRKKYMILDQCNYETSLLYKADPIMHCHNSEVHSLKGMPVIKISEVFKRNRKILIDMTRKLWKTFKIRRETYLIGRASRAMVFIARNKTTGEEFLVG